MGTWYCIEEQAPYTVHYLDAKERVEVVYEKNYRAIQDYPSYEAARNDAQRRFPGGQEVATFALLWQESETRKHKKLQVWLASLRVGDVVVAVDQRNRISLETIVRITAQSLLTERQRRFRKNDGTETEGNSVDIVHLAPLSDYRRQAQFLVLKAMDWARLTNDELDAVIAALPEHYRHQL